MNALKELKEFIYDCELTNIKTAEIDFNNRDRFYLSENHTPKELELFWDFLNREYDNGYGWQELFGIVVFQDGIVLVREEYDGSEAWKLKSIWTIN